MGRQAALAENVDVDAEQVLELLREGDQIQQATSILHLHEQVEVASLVTLPTRRGPEDPEVRRPMGRRQLDDLIAPVERIRRGRRHGTYGTEPH